MATWAAWSPAVLVVDVLDDLLAPVGLDVDVDVRRAVPLRGEEPLEEQPVPHRVHIGDAAARSRPPSWPPSPGPGSRCRCSRQNVDDVVDDQEVAGEAELLDHRPARGRSARTPSGCASGGPYRSGAPCVGQLAQPGHLGVPGRHRVRRAACGATSCRSKAQLRAELGGPRHRTRVARRTGRAISAPLRRWAVAAGGQPAVDLVQAAPGPDRGERGGQPAPRRAWRSARCWWRPSAARPRRPARPARRCGRRRAGRRGRSARPPRCSAPNSAVSRSSSPRPPRRPRR